MNKKLLVKRAVFRPHYINDKGSLFFNTGDVLKIFYFIKAKNKKKLFFFIGICFAINYNNKNFKIFNYLKSEQIMLTFSFYSPLIL
jgi:ribosomal protein L19